MSGSIRGERADSPNVVQVAVGTAGLLTLLAAFTLVDGTAEALAATLRTTFGSDYLLAAGLGGCALLFAAATFASSAEAGYQATMPEVERPTPVPTPGERFDQRLAGWHGLVPVVTPTARAATIRRLRRTAVRTIVTAEGCRPADAERRVAEGSWTDDPVAAGLLERDAGPPPIAIRLVALRRRETWLAYAADRTVDAIVARRNGVTGQ
jgi:hypothetical protein